MPDTDVIDSAALDKLREWGGDTLLLQMIRLYLENAGERLRQIREGFEHADLEGVERGAHSLKSSAGNVGAVVVNRLAQSMEDLAARGDADGAAELEPSLVEAQDRAERALREVQRGSAA